MILDGARSRIEDVGQARRRQLKAPPVLPLVAKMGLFFLQLQVASSQLVASLRRAHYGDMVAPINAP